MYLVAWKKAWWKAKRLLGHRYEGGKRLQGGRGGRADGDERELLEELLTGHMLRAARGLRRLKFDTLEVLDVLSLDARLLLKEGGGAKEKTVRWFRGTQVGRGQVGGHAQGRGSPRVHLGLQDPVALSWGGVGSIQAEEWAERRDYMERKRIITLLDFQCQRSIFHEGSSCGIMQGGIFRLYVHVSGHSPTGHS